MPKTLAHCLLPALLIFWAGVLCGVSFLATPVKFQAPSLSLPVAVDVGRQTFGLLNQVELGFGLVVALLLWKGTRSVWVRGAGVMALAVVVMETAWLLPVLDTRAEVVIAGGTPPPSRLHDLYIVADGLKLVHLLAAGLLSTRALTAPSSTLKE